MADAPRDGGPAPRRTVSDPRELRALAHPVRIELMELLLREGRAMTATECAEVIGQSPANCSFHLRTLAKYGFVEEVEGGKGRQRPWRATSLGLEVDDQHIDPAIDVAAGELVAMLAHRDLERWQRWLAARAQEPPEWQHGGFMTTRLFYATADEVRELSDAVEALLQRFDGRGTGSVPRPEGSRALSLLAFAVPTEPAPPSEGAANA